MPRLTFKHLPFPKKKFRPSLRSPNFETLESARDEETKRIARLTRALEFLAKKERKQAKELMRHMQRKSGKRTRRSLASSIDMRWYRQRIIGPLAKLAKVRRLQMHRFDLVPHTWRVPAGQLREIDPRKLMQQLRSDLNRSGALEASGGLVAFLHGEFEPGEKVWVLHVHGVAWGDMIWAVEGLREKRKYKFHADALADGEGAVHPVKNAKVNQDLMYRLTYVLKSYWQQRAVIRSPGSSPRRQRQTTRIEMPHFAEHLLWLDRFKIGDVSSYMKVRITKRGLKIGKNCT